MLTLVDIHHDGTDTGRLFDTLPAAIAWLSAVLRVEEVFEDAQPIGSDGFWTDVQEICEDENIIVVMRTLDPVGLTITADRPTLSAHERIAATRLRPSFLDA